MLISRFLVFLLLKNHSSLGHDLDRSFVTDNVDVWMVLASIITILFGFWVSDDTGFFIILVGAAGLLAGIVASVLHRIFSFGR
jgi:hypothetical protein